MSYPFVLRGTEPAALALWRSGALEERVAALHRQVGPLRFGPDGLARRGVLVRHLVMPGQSGESAAILRWLAEELGTDTWVNLMDQYRPAYRVGRPGRDGSPRLPEIDRRPSSQELRAAREAAAAVGLWRLDERLSPGLP